MKEERTLTDTPALPPGFVPVARNETKRKVPAGTVSIAGKGAFSSAELFAKLGNPEAVQVLANPQTREIAFVPSKLTAEAYPVSAGSQISALSPLARHGWRAALGRRHPYRIENGMAIVTLDLGDES